MDLGEYLFQRLAQLGVGSIHGVPGDYNLTALDYLEPSGLHWVGNANELCAGYAADGYARIKGIGALITSFGVGELSAINAIGAAYSERAPVVHIVGTPHRDYQASGACLHHSLGDGNFRVFADMYKSVTCAQANLVDAWTAPELIDATLKECLLQSRPVYIELPTDMVRAKVPVPTFPIDFSIPDYDEAFEDKIVNSLVSRIQHCKQPLILVDGITARFGVKDDINALVKLTGFPTLATPFGKSIIDENVPNYHGVYLGSAGGTIHQSWVQGCDLVLHFGVLGSDINTFGFTAQPPPAATVTFDKYSIFLGKTGSVPVNVRLVSINTILAKLLRCLNGLKIPVSEPYPGDPFLPREILKRLPKALDNKAIDQYSLWLRISRFLQPGDIVMTEAGTASYGGLGFDLPEGTMLVNSSIWLSIGYMLGACQGAALAQREMVSDGTRPPGRTILFEGDGGLQMTAQAISDIIRNKLDVIIFVLNNNGYTIERLIHGFSESYNNIQPWRNLQAPNYFGALDNDASYPVRTKSAQSWGDLQGILQLPDIQEGKGLNIIEISLSMDDAPECLSKFAEYVRKRNSGQL
ncbi:Thiamine pyrophosphate enzyme, C-terminal TPP-binding [Penicillium expansum]|nr:Thiamine pyrophosphate enzyme, C-terminal TPP-binding [Penicillium expansum]